MLFKTLVHLKLLMHLTDVKTTLIAFDRPLVENQDVIVSTFYVGRVRKKGIYRFIYSTYVYEESSPNKVLFESFSLNYEQAENTHQSAILWVKDYYDPA